ncbi:gliding motility-associated C-terminal domain-containing protein [Spirosoma sp. BT702]|uniref:Gliding motility-associated C-terminal domain-containing protein n=1 Tax=Spirosoma profusum TaxID=2771354 RepID=A0A927AQJ6_9BACT|nr:gliding motility-associated C-terminal domain-containing protein [Spirosoma profusum]MBD2700601.1 gliding motility-associated C-terminal domain-containing protein [Spirosoma profusum]
MRLLRLWLTDVRVNSNSLRRIATFLAIIFAYSYTTQAQNVCQNRGAASEGAFELDKPKVCAGKPVNIISVPPTIVGPKYVFQYDGSAITSSTTFASGTSNVYTRPGSYTVLQVGSNGAGSVACREVTVVPAEPVKFTVKACANRRASVAPDLTSLGQYDSYMISWGDGSTQYVDRSQLQLTPSHTYSNAGQVSISITGIYVNGNTSICDVVSPSQPITVSNSTGAASISTLYTSNPTTIAIGYQAPAGTNVTLLRKNGTNYTDTGLKSTTGQFTVQTDATQVQCFKVQVQDECNNSAAQSEEVCSLVMSIQTANRQNTVSWQPYSGGGQFVSYRVLRNGGQSGPTITNKATGSYQDNDNIICGQQYCYQIQATIQGTPNATVTSNITCVTGTNTEPPGSVTNATVSIENGRPRLVTTPPTGLNTTTSAYTMVVSRAQGATGTFEPIATLDRRSTFTDTSANASASSYCYQVTYRNSCGLTSEPSTPVCTVHLSSESPTGIDWTGQSPFIGNVTRYSVEVIDSANGTQREVEVALNRHYEPDQNDPNLQSQRYRIVAVSDRGVRSYSNFFTFEREARILVPDAFTPNGDGINDVFIAKGIYVDKFSMTIYSRWGEVIYNTVDKTKGWDGNANGEIAGSGQYMYRIEMTDLLGTKTVRTGALLLVR